VKPLLGVILWSAAYLVVARDLQHEFEVKSQTLATLKRQTLSRFSASGNLVQVATEGVISAPTGTIAASELHKSVLASLEKAGGAVHSIHVEIIVPPSAILHRALDVLVNNSFGIAWVIEYNVSGSEFARS
jgi:hypothetical protein